MQRIIDRIYRIDRMLLSVLICGEHRFLAKCAKGIAEYAEKN